MRESQQNASKENDTPLISVVIPTRNEGAHLRAVVDSLLNQTYPAHQIEVLVVDGASTDNSWKIAQELEQMDSRVRALSNPKQYVAAGFNIGIAQSKGELLAIVGGHTVVDRKYLEEAVRILDDHPEIIGTGGPVVPRAKSDFGQAVAIAMSHPMGIGNATHRYPHFEGYAFGSAFPIFRKWIFDKVGVYDEELIRNQDDDFFLRLEMAGYKNYISPKIRSEYFVRETPSQLWRQFEQYGYWRVAVIRKLKRPASLRQLAPFSFYLLLLLLGVFAPLAALSLFGLYFCILVAGSASMIRKHPFSSLIRLPIALVLMHSGYAFGFAKGLIDFVLLGRKSTSMARLSR